MNDTFTDDEHVARCSHCKQQIGQTGLRIVEYGEQFDSYECRDAFMIARQAGP